MTVNTGKLVPKRGLTAATQTYCMGTSTATCSKCSMPYLSDKASQCPVSKVVATILNELLACLSRNSMQALSCLNFQCPLLSKRSLSELFISFNVGKRTLDF